MAVILFRFYVCRAAVFTDEYNRSVVTECTNNSTHTGCGESCVNFEDLQAALFAAKISTHFRVLKYSHVTFFQSPSSFPYPKRTS